PVGAQDDRDAASVGRAARRGRGGADAALPDARRGSPAGRRRGMSAPPLVEVTEADTAALRAVSGSAGWPHSVDDWRAVLESARVFAHRAHDGEVISSGAVFPLGPALAAIGMIIVKPAHRGRGLARAMMLRCLACLGSAPPAFVLIATPQGRPLYEHLGFE